MSKKVHCRSLSSIHILYNQALVGGLSVSYVPATWIDNIQLDRGSTKMIKPSSRCSTRVVSGPEIMYRRGRGYAPASLALVSHSHGILLHDWGASRQSTRLRPMLLTATGRPPREAEQGQRLGQPQSLFVSQSVHLIKGCSFSFLAMLLPSVSHMGECDGLFSHWREIIFVLVTSDVGRRQSFCCKL